MADDFAFGLKETGQTESGSPIFSLDINGRTFAGLSKIDVYIQVLTAAKTNAALEDKDDAVDYVLDLLDDQILG